jgi:hypothetical protein
MTVAIINDVRNVAQRTSVLENPFWMTTSVLNAADTAAIDDKVVILFSFPKAGQRIIVRQFACEVITGFNSGTTAVVGYYTLATDAITTGGVATAVGSVNQIEATTGTTYTSAGWYFSLATSAWVTYSILGVPTVDGDLIIGAATTVYAICATFANAGSVATGKCRWHLEVSIVPGS